jgi:hypothetical protein
MRSIAISIPPPLHQQKPGLRTSEDDHSDKKVLRGTFGPEKANIEPVVDDDHDDDGGAFVPGEGILDEPEGDQQGPPQEECIVFVGDLARAISDADLEKAFSAVGTVCGVGRGGLYVQRLTD